MSVTGVYEEMHETEDTVKVITAASLPADADTVSVRLQAALFSPYAVDTEIIELQSGTMS